MDINDIDKETLVKLKDVTIAFSTRIGECFKDSPIEKMLFIIAIQPRCDELFNLICDTVGTDKAPEILRAYADSFDLINQIAKADADKRNS